MKIYFAPMEGITDVKGFTLDAPAWNTRTNCFYSKLGYSEVRRDGEFIYYLKSVSSV